MFLSTRKPEALYKFNQAIKKHNQNIVNLKYKE